MKKISIVLISFLLCPVAFAQALGTTKGYYSATQVDSMLWQTLFVATNSFDALGAAHNATNGYPWGSLYDTANAALNATNALGSAAWKSTSFFDLSGAGTTAATAATNAGNIMFTNALPALTNGFVTASITMASRPPTSTCRSGRTSGRTSLREQTLPHPPRTASCSPTTGHHSTTNRPR